MSFQAYLDPINKKTGLTPNDLRHLADEQGWTEAGILKSSTKAGCDSGLAKGTS